MSPAGRVAAALSALLGLAPAAIVGQQPGVGSFVHESWTVEDGLPLNSIRQVLQSRDGYIWIATLDGLARYDGVRFTPYNSANSPELPNNRIVSIFEGRDSTLWLQTEAWQLVRLRKGRFTHIGPEHGLVGAATKLYEDLDGVLWIGTDDGLGRMEGDRFVPVAKESIRGVIQAIVRHNGALWVSTQGSGLVRLTGDRVEKVVSPAAIDTTIHWSIADDGSGRLWLSTNSGAWADDGIGFRRHTGTALVEAGGRLHPIDERLLQEPQPGGVRMPGAIDRDGKLWFINGTRLYSDSGSVLDLQRPDHATDAAALLTSLVVDREGNIWLGTFNLGLHRLKPALFRTLSTPEGLLGRNTLTVHQDRTGAIWVGGRSGLSRIDAQRRVTSWSHLGGSRYDVFSILSDSTGHLWVGTGTSLVSCVLPLMSCHTVTDSSVSGKGALALYRDSKGRLWVGTGVGVAVLEEGRWREPADGLDPVTVRALAETGDGAVWMGTNGQGLLRSWNGGFSRIDRTSGLPSDLVRALYVDRDGWLWVGTEGRGLARVDPRSWDRATAARRIVHIGPEHGLYDGVIHQILMDDSDRLWMSSNRGIFWIPRGALLALADGRATRVHSTSYTERDGMRNREANGGSQPAGIRARDGRLWFPTQDGVTVVDPARVTETLLPVIVEAVTSGDTTWDAGAIPARFGVKQRDLSIAYTAPAFLAPGNIRFRYRLDPYDADWIEAGDRRTAFYTRLPPGRYTFRVIASTLGNVWNEGTPLELELAPRFRETSAAKLLLGLILLGLTLAIFRLRLNSLHRRGLELSRLVEERTAELRLNEVALAAQNSRLAEMDQAKSRLFANLSHEFRTPLTLILGPLRSILDGRHGPVPNAVREQSDLMFRNGQRLLRLINQVLDLTKLQAGQMRLDLRSDDLVGLTRRVTLAFAPLAERRQITLRFCCEHERVPVRFDAEQLEKVLLNLLSNAVKFTAAGGRVDVLLSAGHKTATLAVRDTGVGIRPEELSRIFERFYQADTSTTRRYEGTGIGLALARELVELHGGEIRAESMPGAGSTFVATLPLDTTQETAPAVAGSLASAPALDVAALVAADPAGPTANGPESEREDRTTVLVVDDNPDVRTYVRSVLAPTYEVIDATNGRTGLERARADLPDLIVADVMMPELDGLAMGKALKGDPMTDAIPVVLLTARAAAEDQIAGLETGADAYLIKPFDPDVLEAQVANLLAQRKRLRERFRSGDASPPAPAPQALSELERRLRSLVEAYLIDPGFGPNELAEAASLTYNQLYYALHEQLHTTPSRFIRGVRVECAALLLRQRAGSVTEVAYSVGFESLSYFNRAFRERFGTSPTGYMALPSSV